MNIQSLKAEANEDVEALCAWLEKGALEALALERVRSPASSFGAASARECRTTHAAGRRGASNLRPRRRWQAEQADRELQVRDHVRRRTSTSAGLRGGDWSLLGAEGGANERRNDEADFPGRPEQPRGGRSRATATPHCAAQNGPSAGRDSEPDPAHQHLRCSAGTILCQPSAALHGR